MKKFLTHINTVFENRLRRGVMSSVAVSKQASFADLKQLLEANEVRLHFNLRMLEENGFLMVQKGLWNRKKNKRYSITPAGEMAIRQHLLALENMVKEIE